MLMTRRSSWLKHALDVVIVLSIPSLLVGQPASSTHPSPWRLSVMRRPTQPLIDRHDAPVDACHVTRYIPA